MLQWCRSKDHIKHFAIYNIIPACPRLGSGGSGGNQTLLRHVSVPCQLGVLLLPAFIFSCSLEPLLRGTSSKIGEKDPAPASPVPYGRTLCDRPSR